MDDVNRPAALNRAEASELTADGLVLWRLSASGQPDLWCMAFELPDALYFVLEDDPHGTQAPRVTERHAGISTLVDRAETLKRSLLRCGWTEAEGD